MRPLATTNGSSIQAQRDEIIETVQGKFGFVPNLIPELAESPAVARAYLGATDALAEGSLSQEEQQVVQTTVAAYNECHYCTAVHGTLGLKDGLSREDVSAILSGGLPEDERLRAIVTTTRKVLDERGWLDPEDVRALEGDGISKAELYEIIAFVGVKTITNYINHIAHTDVDDQFSAITELPAYQSLTGTTALSVGSDT